jgi:catechol 2,3-dioxygenase-like lactoylglutathione lyase family enzyme
MTIKRLDHVSVVDDDLTAAIAFFTALGMTLEDKYRLCYMRGPANIIVALAEELS